MSRTPADPNAVDQPREPAELRGVGWTWAVIAIACAVLLLFNAASIRSWVAQAPPGALSAALQATTERWWAFTERAGLTAPRAVIGRLWSAAGDLRWPGPAVRRSPGRQR
ncbi:MAG TPA: hypothetical protein VKQ54_00935 [Caulobacteraceae bacterium]|nr:hypothetical protein [Caulobacteraceae bacterium]